MTLLCLLFSIVLAICIDVCIYSHFNMITYMRSGISKPRSLIEVIESNSITPITPISPIDILVLVTQSPESTLGGFKVD